jgi:hypothetical protein
MSTTLVSARVCVAGHTGQAMTTMCCQVLLMFLAFHASHVFSKIDLNEHYAGAPGLIMAVTTLGKPVRSSTRLAVIAIKIAPLKLRDILCELCSPDCL